MADPGVTGPGLLLSLALRTRAQESQPPVKPRSSAHEPLADRLQFPSVLPARPGILHFQPCDRIQSDLRDDQPRILLIVCGHDIPRGVPGARRAQALLVGFQVILPEPPLGDVGVAEFPVLLRIVDASEEALALLLL